MASFMRPEARASLWRWREVIASGVIIVVGLWWVLGSFGIVRALGMIVIMLGLVFAVAGLQRARFRQTGQGPGVVQLAERRLAFFGPLGGGAMDIADLNRLELDPKAQPAPHWILTAVGGARLEIPVNATGADALFDYFGALPNIQTQQMLDVLSRTPDARVTVWERTPTLLH